MGRAADAVKGKGRQGVGRCSIPAGHSRRTLALLRRKRALRPGPRQIRRCEMCQRWRRIGRWWWPPRKLKRAGAEHSDAGLAGGAALTVTGAYKTYCLWYCRPCWDDWLVRYKQWFSEDGAVSEESLSSSSSTSRHGLDSGGTEMLHYHFVEIGTSNYHTFTQAAGGHPSYKPCAYKYLPKGDLTQVRGLAVDMKKRYLKQLPDLPNVRKVRAAISERETALQMHHVRIKDIEHWERVFATQGNYQAFRLIRLARGCSALGRHNALIKALGMIGLRHLIRVRTMKTRTVQSLFQQNQVGTIGVLALDCEGHDCAILKGLITACQQRREWCADLTPPSAPLVSQKGSGKMSPGCRKNSAWPCANSKQSFARTGHRHVIGRGRDSLAADIPTNVLDRDLEPADAVIETWDEPQMSFMGQGNLS
ncbi:unnamed protein product [Effrenium voratum]|nr:unnamed protein product [Effrenium voratum]